MHCINSLENSKLSMHSEHSFKLDEQVLQLMSLHSHLIE